MYVTFLTHTTRVQCYASIPLYRVRWGAVQVLLLAYDYRENMDMTWRGGSPHTKVMGFVIQVCRLGQAISPPLKARTYTDARNACGVCAGAG